MQNLTAQAAVQRLHRVLEGKEEIARQLGTAAIGFLMSGASIYEMASPFGVAWAGAVSQERAMMASIGAILGYLFSLGGLAGTMRYIAAIILLLGLRWAASFFRTSTIQLVSPLMAAAAVGATGLTAVLSSAGTPYDVMMTLCEVALTATAGYLLIKARQAMATGMPLTGRNGICIALMGALLLMSLSRFTFGKISLGVIAAVLLVLCCAGFAGEGPGAIAGVVAGAAATLTGRAFLLPGLSLGGLTAGLFSPMGRLASAAAFAVTNAIALVAGGGGKEIFPAMIETLVASVLFMVVPASVVKKVGVFPDVSRAQGQVLQKVAAARLDKTKEALADIATITGQVTKQIDKMGGDDFDTVLASAADDVCRKCKDSPRCWQSSFSDTMSALNSAAAVVRGGATAKILDFPDHFARSCRKPEALLNALNTRVGQYVGRQGAKKQVSQMRSVVTDQFEGMSMVLDAVKEEIMEISAAAPALDRAVAEYFESVAVSPQSVSCYNDCYGRTTVIVDLPAHKLNRLNLAEVSEELSEIVEQELDEPDQVVNGQTVQLWFTGKAQYTAKFGFSQLAAGGSRFCGDSCVSFCDQSGQACMVISDGMGVGGSAAVDATMTTSLLSRLVRSGVKLEAALRLVNSALLLKAGEERLATVDAALLDLYTCQLTLYKAGAAPTFVIRQGRVATVESASLPAGILDGISFEKTALNLAEGDVIVMVSDGVTDTGSEWIPSQLAMFRDLAPDEICAKLLEVARARRIDGHEDDMTAMAAVVSKVS